MRKEKCRLSIQSCWGDYDTLATDSREQADPQLCTTVAAALATDARRCGIRTSSW